MTILDRLAEYAKIRVQEAKKRTPLEEIRRLAFELPKGNFAFENALKTPDVAFICECKKASPSKGVLAPEYPYLNIAREYDAAGAECVSVLTEPKWFLGADEQLKEIAAAIARPVLRKDFTVDEYMIYEAKILGASAVLLIASLLSRAQIERWIGVCDALGLTALTEIRDEEQAKRALDAGARVVGVNNRNLNDFSVDVDASRRLRDRIPSGILFVSESGLQRAADVEKLREIGADAALVGETLMRASDKKAKLAELRESRR